MKNAKTILMPSLGYAGQDHAILARLWFNPLLARAHAAELGQPSNATGANRRIMLVDDERDIAMTFKSGLERRGFTVDVFNDPMEALANFKHGYYDLLLLDVRMPSMNGFELLANIRKLDGKAKVCFVSAFEVHEEELRKYLPDEDGNCILKKPILMKDLVKAINERLSDD